MEIKNIIIIMTGNCNLNIVEELFNSLDIINENEEDELSNDDSILIKKLTFFRK